MNVKFCMNIQQHQDPNSLKKVDSSAEKINTNQQNSIQEIRELLRGEILENTVRSASEDVPLGSSELFEAINYPKWTEFCSQLLNNLLDSFFSNFAQSVDPIIKEQIKILSDFRDKISIKLIDVDTITAFCYPQHGGIFLSTGLLKKIYETASIDTLAFVIGHELGHMIYENISVFKDYKVTNTAASFFENSLNMEFECDKFALLMVDSTKYNVKFANLDFLRDGSFSEPDNGIISSHPHTGERNKKLKEYILQGSFINYSEAPSSFESYQLESISTVDKTKFADLEYSIKSVARMNLIDSINSYQFFFEKFRIEPNSLRNAVSILYSYNKNSQKHKQLKEYIISQGKLNELHQHVTQWMNSINFFSYLSDPQKSTLESFQTDDLVTFFFSDDFLNSIHGDRFWIENFSLPLTNLEKNTEISDLVDIQSLHKIFNTPNPEDLFHFIMNLDKTILSNPTENQIIIRILKQTKGILSFELESITTKQYFELISRLQKIQGVSDTFLNVVLNSIRVSIEITNSEALKEIAEDVFNSKKDLSIANFYILSQKNLNNLILNEIRNGNYDYFYALFENKYIETFPGEKFIHEIVKLDQECFNNDKFRNQIKLFFLKNPYIYQKINKPKYDSKLKTMLESDFEIRQTLQLSDAEFEFIKLFPSSYDTEFNDQVLDYLQKISINLGSLEGLKLKKLTFERGLEIIKNIQNQNFPSKQAIIDYVFSSFTKNRIAIRSIERYNSNFEATDRIDYFFGHLTLAQLESFLYLIEQTKIDKYCYHNVLTAYMTKLQESDSFNIDKLRELEEREFIYRKFSRHSNSNLENQRLESVIEGSHTKNIDYIYFYYASKNGLLNPELNTSEQKVNYIKDLIDTFKKPSNYIAKLIAENLDQETFNRFDVEYQDSILKMISKSPIKAQIIGAMYYKKNYDDNLSIEQKKELVLKCFTVASKTRDQILEQIIMSSEVEVNELIQFNRELFSFYNGKALRDQTILEGTFGSTIRNYDADKKYTIFQHLFLKKDSKSTEEESFYSVRSLFSSTGLSADSVKELLDNQEIRDAIIDDLINCDKSMLNYGIIIALVDSLFKEIDTQAVNPKVLAVTKAAIISILNRKSKFDSSNLIKELINSIYNQEKDFNIITKKVLLALGVTGVKIAQILSSQPFLKETSPSLYNTLSELKDQASPMELIQFLENIVFNQNLQGKTITIEKVLASASIKSVLKVKIDGEDYVLKVLKPNANKFLTEAKTELSQILEDLGPIFKEQFDVVLPDLAHEIIKWIQEETDFYTEVQNLERLKLDSESTALSFNLSVPQVRSSLGNANMIIEDIVPGLPLKDIQEPGLKESIYKDLQVLVLKQLYVDGFFHADLHDGNIFFDQDTQTISLIDAGFCTNLSEPLQFLLINLIDGKSNIADLAQRYIAENGLLLPDEDFQALTQNIKQGATYYDKLIQIQEFIQNIDGFTTPDSLNRVIAGLTKTAYIFDEVSIDFSQLLKQWKLGRAILDKSPIFVERQLENFLNNTEKSNTIANLLSLLTNFLNLSPRQIIEYIIQITDQKIAQNDNSEIKLIDVINAIKGLPAVVQIQTTLIAFGMTFQTAVQFLTGEILSTNNPQADFMLTMIKSNLNNPQMLQAMLAQLNINNSAVKNPDLESQDSKITSVEDLSSITINEENYKQVMTFLITKDLDYLKNIDLTMISKEALVLIKSRINYLINQALDLNSLHEIQENFEMMEGDIMRRKIYLIENDLCDLIEVIKDSSSNISLLKSIDEIFTETFERVKNPDSIVRLEVSYKPLDEKIKAKSILLLSKDPLRFIDSFINSDMRNDIQEYYKQQIEAKDANALKDLVNMSYLENDNSEYLIDLIANKCIQGLSESTYLAYFFTPSETNYVFDINNKVLQKVASLLTELDKSTLLSYYEKLQTSSLKPVILITLIKKTQNFNDTSQISKLLSRSLDPKESTTLFTYLNSLETPLKNLTIKFSEIDQHKLSNLANIENLVINFENWTQSLELQGFINKLSESLTDDSVLRNISFNNIYISTNIEAIQIPEKLQSKIQQIEIINENITALDLSSLSPQTQVKFSFLSEIIAQITLHQNATNVKAPFLSREQLEKISTGQNTNISFDFEDVDSYSQIIQSLNIKFINKLINEEEFNQEFLNKLCIKLEEESNILQIVNLKIKGSQYETKILAFLEKLITERITLLDTLGRIEVVQNAQTDIFEFLVSKKADSLDDQYPINLINMYLQNISNAFLTTSIYKKIDILKNPNLFVDCMLKICEYKYNNDPEYRAKLESKVLSLFKESIQKIEDLKQLDNLIYKSTAFEAFRKELILQRALKFKVFNGSVEDLQSCNVLSAPELNEVNLTNIPSLEDLIKILELDSVKKLNFYDIDASDFSRIIAQLDSTLKQKIKFVRINNSQLQSDFILEGMSLDFVFKATSLTSAQKIQIDSCASLELPSLTNATDLDLSFHESVNLNRLEAVNSLSLKNSNSSEDKIIQLENLKEVSTSLRLIGFSQVLIPSAKVQAETQVQITTSAGQKLKPQLKVKAIQFLRRNYIICNDPTLIKKL